MKPALLQTLLGAAALLTTLPATAADTLIGSGQLRCHLSTGLSPAANAAEPLLPAAPTQWTIEVDDTLPLAVVDDSDRPADYSGSHIRIRLDIDGPTLTIGRSSGRLVATDGAGKPLGAGFCTPQVMAVRGLPRTG